MCAAVPRCLHEQWRREAKQAEDRSVLSGKEFVGVLQRGKVSEAASIWASLGYQGLQTLLLPRLEVLGGAVWLPLGLPL